MSNLENEILLEQFFEEFIEEGFSKSQAKELAHKKLEGELDHSYWLSMLLNVCMK